MAESLVVRTLLFRLERAVYGCDIGLVREIVPQRQATRLPGTPPWVNGLVNLRGTMLTVIDLGMRLERDATPTTEGSIILIEAEGRRLGVVVRDVMDVTPLTVEPPPEDRPDEVVLGLGHLGPTVVIVIDIRALMRQVLL
ncbi:MAG TPA: chemotaxis protein CheW [Gemmatimonadaceae bacterium]|jgi:purine-binding chemotaxis protein CheW|nr:chemotaxis protein CheW [Gemmatimonadaceae bacterium]